MTKDMNYKTTKYQGGAKFHSLRSILLLVVMLVGGASGVWADVVENGKYYRIKYLHTSGEFYLYPSTSMYAEGKPLISGKKTTSISGYTDINITTPTDFDHTYSLWKATVSTISGTIVYQFINVALNSYMVWTDATTSRSIYLDASPADITKTYFSVSATTDVRGRVFPITDVSAGTVGSNSFDIQWGPKDHLCATDGSGNQNNTSNGNVLRFSGSNTLEFIEVDYSPNCATPTITYDDTTGDVTIASETAGATIYYTSTTDGSTPEDPTESSPNSGTSPVVINDVAANTKFKAFAVKEGLGNSEIAEATIEKLTAVSYAFDSETWELTMTSDEETTIYYTTDGSTPTTAATTSGPSPLTITSALSSMTIKAFAVKDGYIASDVSTNDQTIPVKTVSIPTIILEPNRFTYDGSAKEPTVTVKDGDVVIPSSEYTVTYTNNTDIGTATVTITDNSGGDYNISGSTTFSIAPAYTYYALHQNGSGYLRVNGGDVTLSNHANCYFNNIFNNEGNSIWVLSEDGYLKNEYFYLNVINNATLCLSVNPVTQWELEDVVETVGEVDVIKHHIKTKDSGLYLYYDSGVKLSASPSGFYNACPINITEVSWTAPASSPIKITVQSPQMVTYLRQSFTQTFNYSFVNDAGTAVSGENQTRNRYATLTYIDGEYAGKQDTWNISDDKLIIYSNTSSNVTANVSFTLTPADPIAAALSEHTADRGFQLTLQPRYMQPDNTKNYLLFYMQNVDYRFPYDDGIASGNPVKPNATKDVLTEDNTQIQWKIADDGKGFYSFQNASTGRWLYFDSSDYAHSSNYGVVKMGETSLPSDDNRYKFRLFKTGNYKLNNINYGDVAYIIPYDLQFVVYNSGGIANSIYSGFNVYASPNVISLYNPKSSVWRIYPVEYNDRLISDYSISGPNEAYSTGDYEFTATTYYYRSIKDAPDNSRDLVVAGTYTNANVNYDWTVSGLDGYITTTNNSAGGNGKLTISVTSLPSGEVSGTISVKASTTTPVSLSNTVGPFTFTLNNKYTNISSLSEITDDNGVYRLTTDVNASEMPQQSIFKGTLDGNGHTVSGLTAPLFTTLTDNATVCNLNLSSVSITTHSGITGAIACTANGSARIYNVGIFGGEVKSTGTSTDNGSTDCCGGLVGLLDGEARVINCFSYANITGGNRVGGIVGYNNVETTSLNIKTMVMNCMFYGDITGGESKAPIYNGKIITNVSTGNNANNKGLSNFNYFRAEASYVRHIDVYNCALMAEIRFLQRFEFFRHILNSNRALAAWWATGDVANKDQMMKWVMEPSQLGTDTPYPILKAPGRYPSVVNYEIDDISGTATSLGTLTVNIQMGDGEVFNRPTGAAITTSQLDLNITDKDPEHYNFNYYKVQLPYYNDVGTMNYTGNRVVTGWKIVSITGGTTGSFTTGADATTDADGNITSTPYNFADRNCTAKDLYSTSHRVFNQGAYWDVPEGVTAITIEPYWAKAAYVSDPYYDKVYNVAMSSSQDVTAVGGGQRYKNDTYYSINGNSQKVYTTIGNAKNALAVNKDHGVYDYAIVLVGNTHNGGITSGSIDEPYTIMSADLDGDNEPDNSYILRFDGRVKVHPVRVDFLNIPGLGMAQKSTGGTGSYNFGIMSPLGWFESTNTSLFLVTQFEYDYNKDGTKRAAAPYILQGGIMEQWVNGQDNGAANQTTYFHVGGNVWFKEFHRGTHIDKTLTSNHPPLSVTGGDYDEFYLTGLYKAVTTTNDNAECYINGGRFGTVAGAGMEGIGGGSANNYTNGNIVWQIQNADIDEFYGGGINAESPVRGNITTVITGGYIKQFCGGPKFGDMTSDKNGERTVKTTATNCKFDTFFGAGYGGNSYSRCAPKNATGINGDYGETSWNKFVTDNYKQEYADKNDATGRYKGVSTKIDYQYLPQSNNTQNVARIFVDYVLFSLARTHNVTSRLTGCTINKNFYGGGSLGMVSGSVTSTLDNCIVTGDVFGAGFSATLPTVAVMNKGGFKTAPYFDSNLGAYFEPEYPDVVPYTWRPAEKVTQTSEAINTTDKILYTTEDLDALGTVSGNVTLNIIGDKTVITGDVYGGGALASSNTDCYTKAKPTDANFINPNAITTVNLLGGTIHGDVYGGGMGRLEKAAVPAVGTEGEEGYIPAESAIEAVAALVGNTKVNLNGMETSDYQSAYSAWGLKHADDSDPYTVATDSKGCIVSGTKHGRIFGCNNVNGTPKGTVTVHVYATQNVSAATIANPAEGSQTAKVATNYDVEAVYGGGNLAAYEPTKAFDTDAEKAQAYTHVIIDGCDLTSIRQVYGGGNAASTPATKVDINGTFEIEEAFGGGNGKDEISHDGGITFIKNPGANVGFKDYWDYENEKDLEDYDTKAERQANATFLSDYVYGSGAAQMNVHGGKVHRVYGGSNTRGNVRITAVTILADESGCPLDVDEAYGGGKSAPMDATSRLEMACIPGLKVAYGGAENANIEGDVELNITNGNFDRVFGGNNISGTISGTITVNVEETGCKPVIIGQLYGGGNQAAYTGPLKAGSTTERQGPQVNVKSFTSIGEVYGGGYGVSAKVEGDTEVNINVTDGIFKDGTYEYSDGSTVAAKTGERTITFTEYARNENGDFLDASGNVTTDESERNIMNQTVTVDVPAFTPNGIGAIGVVYGGGNAAKVVGSTSVNIGTDEYVYQVEDLAVGATLPEDSYTRGSNGTYTVASGEAAANTTYYKRSSVKGAKIVGNVYGGGNQAEVTGNANVTIGKKTTTTP